MKTLFTNILSLLMIFILGACKDKDPQDVPGELLSFSVVDQNGANYELNVNNQKNIISNRESFPSYVNIARLVAQFKFNRTDVVLKINDVQQQSGKGQTDFTKGVVYDLFIGSAKQRSYSVNITKEAMSNTFRSFAFRGEIMALFPVVIDEEESEISNENEIPKNIDITALQPTFTLNESRAIVKVNGVKQVSGVQRHDFSQPVVYTVEGEDGSSRTYTVRLNQGSFVAIRNPVISGSYADPTAIRVGNEIYVYVTGGRVRGYKSTDLINWNRIGSVSEVFTTRPNWIEEVSGKDPAGMWAPDINHFDGRYVMYYSLSQWGEGTRAGIGVAVSNLPQGPFTGPSSNPTGKLFTEAEIGVHNSIDPAFVEDNGKRYLFWGSYHGLYMTELTADGMEVKDLNVKTKVAGNSFEGVDIHKRGGYYYLFASVGTCCNGLTSTYAVVVGRSTNLAGPYVNRNGVQMLDIYTGYTAPSNYNPVILQGNDTFVGPGHHAKIITDNNGVDWMLYHSYMKENNAVSSRNLMLGKVNWDSEGWPIVDNGTPSLTLTEMPVF